MFMKLARFMLFSLSGVVRLVMVPARVGGLCLFVVFDLVWWCLAYCLLVTLFVVKVNLLVQACCLVVYVHLM